MPSNVPESLLHDFHTLVTSQGWAVAAAITAGLFGLITLVVTQWRTAVLEREKWERAVRDAHAARVRDAMKQWAEQAAGAAHSMTWLTWIAQHRPTSVDQGLIDRYDAEMHAIWPKLMGAHAAMAALDSSLCDALSGTIRELASRDGTLGLLATNPETRVSALAEKWSGAAAYEESLHVTIRTAIDQHTGHVSIQAG